jgi:hypothetical protein
MSYRSRLDYYRHLQKNHSEKNIPIVASHVAATGVGFNKYWAEKQESGMVSGSHKVVVARVKGSFKTHFYPVSLNLFDEEIALIVDSRGLIGISMDQRMLGYKADKKYRRKWGMGDSEHEVEFFSPNDFLALNRDYHDQVFPPSRMRQPEPTSHLLTLAGPETGNRHIHANYIANNILHFVKAGGPQTWKCLTIGSDFDGLVDATQACKNATEFSRLKRYLTISLVAMFQKLRDTRTTYDIDNSSEASIKNSVEGKLDDVLFNNGKEFLDRYFQHFDTPPGNPSIA